MYTYKIDILTDLHISQTLKLRIHTLWERRAKLPFAYRKSYFNDDIREAIETYRNYNASRQ
jgi:hypothetical protein